MLLFISKPVNHPRINVRQVANLAVGTGERWMSGAYERGEGLLVIFVLGVKKAMI